MVHTRGTAGITRKSKERKKNFAPTEVDQLLTTHSGSLRDLPQDQLGGPAEEAGGAGAG